MQVGFCDVWFVGCGVVASGVQKEKDKTQFARFINGARR